MTLTRWKSRARRLGVALLMGAVAASAVAIPVIDMRIEDMLPMGPDFKAELKLNANQQILWQKVDAQSHKLVRDRRARRERLETGLRQRLAEPNVELRDLVAGLDAETATSVAEEQQLRAAWLEVNDALDETQRQAVARFFGEQMLRKMDGGAPPGGARGKEEGTHGGRGGRPGGGPGGSAGMGAGGVNVTLPGN